MPRKPKPKPDDLTEYERFVVSAKKHGADRDSEALGRALKKIAASKAQTPR